MTYRADIDGLRAIAVLVVIFFHAEFPFFTGGFIGVDVFFVISGYLITRLMYNEYQAGTFSFSNFYIRRARRILPALIFIIILCCPAAWILMAPDAFIDFSKSVSAAALFASNFFFWQETGYFSATHAHLPLLHTWSLSIEEQFYIVFPALFGAVWFYARKALIPVLIIISLLSFALGIYWAATHPSAGFYLAPSRLWELLAGSLCVFLTVKPNRISRLIFPWLGLALIGGATLGYTQATPFPSYYALAPVLGAVLIILFCRAEEGLGRVLSLRPLVGIGLISYSAYLWHQPVFVFARLKMQEEPSFGIMAVLIVVSLFLAYLTWKYIETPFRKPKEHRERGVVRALLASAFTVGLVAGLGLIGSKTDLHETYFSASMDAQDMKLFSFIETHTNYDLSEYMGDDGACNFWVKDPKDIAANKFLNCQETFGKAVIVLGDSHAMNIYNFLYRANVTDFMIGISQGGCRPHDTIANCHLDRAQKFLSENKDAINRVYYHQSGSHLIRDYQGRNDSNAIFDSSRDYTIDTENIVQVGAYLNSLSADNDVIWLGPFVEARVNFRNLETVEASGLKIAPYNFEVFRTLETQIKTQHISEDTRYEYISLIDVLDMDENSLVIEGCLTFRDGDHFSRCGEALFGETLAANLFGRESGRKTQRVILKRK